MFAILLLIGVSINDEPIQNDDSGMPVEKSTPPVKTRKDSLKALLSAQKHIESRNDPTAYNKKEKAAGVLQIRPIMMREINARLERAGYSRQYSLNDRWDETIAEQMWWDYVHLLHHDHSMERIARCWNGGPRGHKKRATRGYWNLVKNQIEL